MVEKSIHSYHSAKQNPDQSIILTTRESLECLKLLIIIDTPDRTHDRYQA